MLWSPRNLVFFLKWSVFSIFNVSILKVSKAQKLRVSKILNVVLLYSKDALIWSKVTVNIHNLFKFFWTFYSSKNNFNAHKKYKK